MAHSSTANKQPFSGPHAEGEGQPQDDAKQSPAEQAETSVHGIEPEDKRAAGTTGTRQRETLHQNVGGGQAQQHPETPAGQHATGSFSDGKGKK
jgi:hypothetical protein